MSQDQDRSQDRILFHLKTRGPQVAADVGARLDICLLYTSDAADE